MPGHTCRARVLRLLRRPLAREAATLHDRPVPHDLRRKIIAEHHAATARCARNATIELVRSGYHIGSPPYGYRAIRTVPGQPGRKPRQRLVPDPSAAPVVRAIFTWRVHNGLSLNAIADRLNTNAEHCPPPNRTSDTPRWSPSAIRTILNNPVYTGRTVWGRTRHGRPVPPEHWITSAPGNHRALVNDRTFARANRGKVGAE